MIKREMIFRNTCEECNFEWLTDIGEKVSRNCPSCKKGPEDSTQPIEAYLSPAEMIEIIKSLAEIEDKIKKNREENPH